MGDTMRLTLQLTAVDMLSGILSGASQHIKALGEAGKQVQRDFDQMTTHITRGLKAIAVANYGWHKLESGVNAAANLQEAMINAKMSLMQAGQSAAQLNADLAKVQSTAVKIQAVTPYSAPQAVDVETALLRAGLSAKDVTGDKGAASAVMALSTISGYDPRATAEGIASIGTTFGISGKQFWTLADQMQKHTQHGQAKLEDVFEAMKLAGSKARTMGLSWQDTLTALEVLGERGIKGTMGGTAIREFLSRLTGGARGGMKVLPELNAQLRAMGKAPLEFWDKSGNLKKFPDIINNMREAFGSFNKEKRMFYEQRLFGQEGGNAADVFMEKGRGDWDYIVAKMGKAVSLEEEMVERLKGFNANVQALKGTLATTLAIDFKPLLDPFTDLLKVLNDIAAKFGEWGIDKKTGKSTTFAKALSGSLGLGVIAAGGYGLYRLGKGSSAGLRVLRGLGGAGGVASGLMEGKIVQTATGVTPVFVTNWPANLGGAGSPGGGISPLIKGIAAFSGGYAVGTLINKLPNWLGWTHNEGGLGGVIGEGIFNMFHGKIESPPVINHITIDAQTGKVLTETNSLKQQNLINLRRGRL